MKAHKSSEANLVEAGTRNRTQFNQNLLRWFVKTALCPLISAMALSFGCGARAQEVYSIVTNPGENASSEMNIGWHAGLGNTNCFVIYTRKSDSTWAQAAKAKGAYQYCDVFDGVDSKTASGADMKESAVFLNFGATLTSLQPDTAYMYKVCAGEGFQSAIHYFKTAGGAEFSFLWIGDFHAYPPLAGRLSNAVKVLNAALEIDPGVSFIFSTGDVVAWGGSYSFWRLLYEQDFIKDYMFANVVGNHDSMTRRSHMSPDYFRVANNLPRNGYSGQEGVCYWFIYNRVLFITLNNEAMSNNGPGLASAKEWAAGVIRKLAERYDYIFLCEHYQWFNGRSGKTSWYANWKDFCDEYGVALALSGNNHIYERSHPLFHDEVVPDGKGTVYMEAPSSDGDRGVEAGTLKYNTEKLAYTYSSHTRSGNGEVKTIGCVLVKVTAKDITTRLVYLDENKVAQVADEHVAPALPASRSSR